MKNRLMCLSIDALAVLIFATVGRQSHERGLSILGILDTAAPFLVALAIVSLVLWILPGTRSRDVHELFPSGVAIWLVTFAGGLALRVAFGGTAALAFQIVAAVSLAILLIGWRLAWALRQRRRKLRDAPATNG